MAEVASWTEKLDVPEQVEIRPAPEGRKKLRAGQPMLFLNGRALDAAIRTIPAGQTKTLKELRDDLARAYGADIACPVTAGICLRTVAEAAHEAFRAGTPIEEVAPVWRVLDARSPTWNKVSFDPAFMLEQRRREALDRPQRKGA